MLTITTTDRNKSHKEIAQQYTHLINNGDSVKVESCKGTKVFKKLNFSLVESIK